MKSLSHRFQRFILTIAVLLAACFFASPAQANVPLPPEGSYVCTTGQLLVGSDPSSTYTISSGGVVDNGDSCTGAVVIPEGVTAIDDSAFEQSSLASITLPASVMRIGSRAFNGATALTSITIPAGVMEIGSRAFSATNSLTSISVNPANPSFTSIDGMLFNKEVTTLIIYSVAKSATSITIPAGVTTIGRQAFSGATFLTSITMQTGVTTIEQGAFNGMTSLSDITIPEGVTTIGDQAFGGASALTSVTIPASVTSIGDFSFDQASALKDVYFFGNAPDLGDDPFASTASGIKAHISATATRFGDGPTWNGLALQVGVYRVTHNAANGSAVAPGAFFRGGTIRSAPVSTRDGHTLAGWSATSNGSLVTFPYTPSVANDITLFAIWTPITTPTTTTVAPTTTTVAPTTTTVAPTTITTTVAPTTTTTVAPTTPTSVAPPAESVVVALPLANTPLVADNSFAAGGEVSVTFSGFVPGEFVQLIVASTPQVIGSGYANDQGVVTLSGNIPAGLAVGNHTLAVYAPVSGIGFKQPISVEALTLPATGSSQLLWPFMMMLFGGVALIVVSRRRRCRMMSQS